MTHEPWCKSVRFALRLCYALSAVLLGAAQAWAASSTDAKPDSIGASSTLLVRALEEIHLDSRVRVQASDLLLEGTLVHWDVHSLRLHEPAEETEMPLTSVRGLWVQGRGTGRGAKVGSITLGIVGAALGPLSLGAQYLSGSSSRPGAGELAGAAVVGALAGAATGALVGAGLGAAFPMWHRRFP